MSNLTNTTDICYLDPNRTQARQGFDVWLYLAYGCLTFSYININILVFRFWLILSAIFFIIWGCVPERQFQVDTLVFNGVFIIINIIQMIPLLRQVWPVTLSKLEEEIYSRDFHMQMNKKQFKRYYKRIRIQNFRANNSQLCVHSSYFESLIHIAKLSPGWKVCIYDTNGLKLQDLTEGSWLGTIEYIEYQKTRPQLTYWGITAILEKEEGNDRAPNITDSAFLPNADEGCIINFIGIKTIDELANDNIFPMFYKNALQAVWLDYATKYLVKQDTNLIENFYENKRIKRLYSEDDDIKPSRKKTRGIKKIEKQEI